jgi:hypothetical protein
MAGISAISPSGLVEKGGCATHSAAGNFSPVSYNQAEGLEKKLL